MLGYHFLICGQKESWISSYLVIFVFEQSSSDNNIDVVENLVHHVFLFWVLLVQRKLITKLYFEVNGLPFDLGLYVDLLVYLTHGEYARAI